MPALAKLDPDLLRKHHVLVRTDNAFQQRARLRQALWREEHGHPVGLHRGEPLGSSIDLAYGKRTLANFLTETIHDVVRHDVLGPGRDPDALISENRLFANLLSSQPLCFNLFGELARDLDLATRVVGAMAPGRVGRVTRILFEHSPGPRDPRFTGDRSAFDAFVAYDSPAGKSGFLGIEVKYHEALTDVAAPHRPRYDELADAMGCFPTDRATLKAKPLQQIWRDHLLAGALLPGGLGYDEGAFVFLYPEANAACAKAVAAYRAQLTNDATFAVWTLEALIEALRAAGAPVGDALADRYLDRLVTGASAGDGLETILEVGFEGGAITLVGRRGPRGGWDFRVEQDSGTAWELVDEVRRPPSAAPWLSSWDEALAALDSGPWTKMRPLVVHPELAERVLRAVLAREAGDPDSGRIETWRALVGAGAPLHRR